MLITDHLNLTGHNPLGGSWSQGERFIDMGAAYDPILANRCREAARETRTSLKEGVYAGVTGPSYETPAEIRMAERMGADAIGMSTAVEVIVARARGLRCLAFSTITNPAAGTTHERLDHAEVIATTREVAGQLEQLVEGVVTAL